MGRTVAEMCNRWGWNSRVWKEDVMPREKGVLYVILYCSLKPSVSVGYARHFLGFKFYLQYKK
jgi:hypothetical protein